MKFVYHKYAGDQISVPSVITDGGKRLVDSDQALRILQYTETIKQLLQKKKISPDDVVYIKRDKIDALIPDDDPIKIIYTRGHKNHAFFTEEGFYKLFLKSFAPIAIQARAVLSSKMLAEILTKGDFK